MRSQKEMKEAAHLSWRLGPDHLSDGSKVFTIATDSWRRNSRTTLILCLCITHDQFIALKRQQKTSAVCLSYK